MPMAKPRFTAMRSAAKPTARCAEGKRSAMIEVAAGR